LITFYQFLTIHSKNSYFIGTIGKFLPIIFSPTNLILHLKQKTMTTNSNTITLQEAITMTHAYQNSPQFAGLTKAGLISATAVQDLLNQPGCVGVRIYFALNAYNNLTLVLVGTDTNENDMTSGIILDKLKDCPPICNFDSPLL
jgi:hypothetical protein